MLLSKIIYVKASYAYRCVAERAPSPPWQGGVVRTIRSNGLLERYQASDGEAYDYSRLLVKRNSFTPRTLYGEARPWTSDMQQLGGFFEFGDSALEQITFADVALPSSSSSSPGSPAVIMKSLWLVPFGWQAPPQKSSMEWAFFVGGTLDAAKEIAERPAESWDARDAARVLNTAPVFVYRVRTRGGAPPPQPPPRFRPSEAAARKKWCASKTTAKGDETIVTAEYWVFEAQQQAADGYWLKERLCKSAKGEATK